ncbi:hypothetical protein GCM10010349_68170 [Streptomyces flavofungini]|nr:hypothetical protein GCM10010349_68170 [Streptomyces flavofungini]
MVDGSDTTRGLALDRLAGADLGVGPDQFVCDGLDGLDGLAVVLCPAASPAQAHRNVTAVDRPGAVSV